MLNVYSFMPQQSATTNSSVQLEKDKENTDEDNADNNISANGFNHCTHYRSTVAFTFKRLPYRNYCNSQQNSGRKP